MKLTLRQQRFIESYVKHHNATRAAIDSGYSERSARIQGCRLMQNANIKAELSRLKQIAAQNAVMTLIEAQEILTEIARGKLQNYLNKDGSIDPEAVKRGGRDIQEVNLSRGLIKMRSPEAAIKELGDIAQWDKVNAQKINFIFNTGEENNKKTKKKGAE